MPSALMCISVGLTLDYWAVPLCTEVYLEASIFWHAIYQKVPTQPRGAASPMGGSGRCAAGVKCAHISDGAVIEVNQFWLSQTSC